ncbi:MAG TPA: HlyD family type I secretion periplasmic adaptor subunit [Azospirillaceae bacterium]|nr:HlyD family type I secretion periplasmic adaptor subunit [Azospirillaceae bacterium]
MSALDRVLEAHPLPRWHAAGYVVMAAILVFVLWARAARLDEVAVAHGEVVPQSNVRSVQHYEGGIIAEILVRDGDRVAAGQPLLRLDMSASGALREDAEVQLDTLLLQRARLRAEADGTEIALPADVAARRPALARAEAETFAARREQLRNTQEGLNNQLRQRELEVAQLRAKQAALASDLKLARERLALSRQLMERNLTPRLEHLQVEREVEALDGEAANVALAIPRAGAALEEIRGRLADASLKFRKEALEDLAELEPRVARQGEALNVSTDQVRRAQIVSPIDGVVKDLRHHTIGGVVRAGETVLQVVPSDDTLVVQCRLDPADRGYVRPGQPALVKVSAYDYFRFGGLEGTVRDIAADSSQGPDGGAWFEVVVETRAAHIEHGGERLPISPGMQAAVEIRTGDRSVLDYLLKPVLRVMEEGFRER